MGIDAQMFVKTMAKYSKEDVLKLSYRICSAFGPERFWITRRAGEDAWHALDLITKYTQDGPTIYPSVGQVFIEARPATRYYGEGYERGDLPLIISVANWLEENIDDAEVWYGGDSSGVCAKQFDATTKERLWRLFCKVDHTPYVGVFSTLDEAAVPYCDFCKAPMTSNGWGQNYSAFYCRGCGYRIESNDGQLTWKASPDFGKKYEQEQLAHLLVRSASCNCGYCENAKSRLERQAKNENVVLVSGIPASSSVVDGAW